MRTPEQNSFQKEEDLRYQQFKQNLNKKIRIFRLKLLFVYRMNQILTNIKTYGVNNDLTQDGKSKKSYKKSFQIVNNNEILENNIKNKKSKYLFYPDNNKIIFWNILNIVFLLYIGTLMPYFIAFSTFNQFIDYWEKIIDIYFIADILVNFNCAYYEDDIIIQERKQIVIKYLLSYFMLDFVTAIPLSWFMSSSSSKQSLNKILRILKLPKLFSSLQKLKFFSLDFILKVFKLDNIWKYKIQTKKNLIKSIKFSITIYFFIHIGACIFASIGQLSNLAPNTWIYQENLQNMSNQDIYISAIYYCFVVLTTVGYGDISSHNTYERLFTIIWMIFGIAFYSFIISFITFFFNSRENQKSLLYKRIEDLREFSKKHKLSKDLKEQIANGLQFSSQNISYRWLNSDFQIFKHLPIELKYESLKQIHKELFECPVFHNKDKNFIVYLISLLKPVKLKKGEILWQINDRANYIVFLTKGQFFQLTKNLYLRKYNQYISKNMKKSQQKQTKNKSNRNNEYRLKSPQIVKSNYNKNQVIKTKSKQRNCTLKEKDTFKQAHQEKIQQILSLKNFLCKIYVSGSYFGDEEIFTKKNRQFCIQAATDVEYFVLSKVDFEKNLKFKFPQIYEKLVEWTMEKISSNNQAKYNVLTFMREVVSRFNVKIASAVDISNVQNLKDINNKSRQQKIQTLKDIYQDSNQDNAFETHFKNLQINELYSQNLWYDQQEKQLYKKVRTPGLQKIYQEWKILKLQKIQANLQEQHSTEIKSLLLFPEQEKVLQNKEDHKKLQIKYNQIQKQMQKSKNLMKKLENQIQYIIRERQIQKYYDIQLNKLIQINQQQFQNTRKLKNRHYQTIIQIQISQFAYFQYVILI